MSDSNEPKSPKETEQVLQEDGLQKVFDDWDAERSALPILGVDDLTAEDLSLEHEEKKRPEAIIERSRNGLLRRLLLLVALSLVVLISMVSNHRGIAFYFQEEDDKSDLGDLRRRWINGERPGSSDFPAMKDNTWVRFQNAIPTEERESETGTFFFFEPILKAVVVTTRTIPEKNIRHNALHFGLSNLVNERWIYPADLSSSFSGEGRLIRASEAPRRYRGIIKLYRRELRLTERIEMEDLWLFLDGAQPSGQTTYLLIYLFALLIVGLGIWFYMRARARHLLLLEEIRVMEQLKESS